MIFVFGPRGSGKTRALVEVAHMTGAVIVVSDRSRMRDVMRCAVGMGMPDVTVCTFEHGGMRGCSSRVYVDDAERIIERVVGCPVDLVTVDAGRIDMRKMTFLDMLAEWRRQRRIEKRGPLEEQS